MSGTRRLFRILTILVAGIVWLGIVFGLDPAVQAGSPIANVRVSSDATLGSYTRSDGQQDQTMLACSTSRRAQNEPSVAVDPHDPTVVVAGANESCDSATAPNQGWLGYYRSTNGGQTWQDSLVPGYPADTSPAGITSPVHGTCSIGSDPTQYFDKDGRLFYGFICFNRSRPANLSLYVSTYDQDAAHYVRTVRVAAGTPAPMFAGLLQDKPNLVADQTNSPFSGNVYVAWSRLAGGGVGSNSLYFSRSTDHGVTFSRPIKIVGPQDLGPFFPDLAVGPDGAIYISYRTDMFSPPDATTLAISVIKSTDGGRTFGGPVQVATVRPFDSFRFSGGSNINCGDGSAGACSSGLTFSRFFTISAVAADETGVHVVWNAEEGVPPASELVPPTNQGRIFVRNSPDGINWPSPSSSVDSVSVGHQFLPDIASSDGVLSVVFVDSRNDSAFAPNLPPGNTADGGNSGGAVDTFVAQSNDGGQTWSETRISDFSSNYDWENGGGTLRIPFWGDYIYISSVRGVVQVVWVSSRDVVSGSDPREVGEADDQDGFDVLQTCTWVPNDINAISYSAPSLTDSCLSLGGLDQNIYSARIT